MSRFLAPSQTPTTSFRTGRSVPILPFAKRLPLIACALVLWLSARPATAAGPALDCDTTSPRGAQEVAHSCNPAPVENPAAFADAAIEWIVLAQEAHASTAPSHSATTLTLAMRYPATVREVSRVFSKEDPATQGTQWIAFRQNGRQLYLPAPLMVRRTVLLGAGNMTLGREVVDRHTPLPLDYKPTDLVTLPQKWNYHGTDLAKRLRRDVAQAGLRMLGDAQKASIYLRITSAYRSATTQRYLYLRKIERSGLGQKLVAKPGHSEHQLGTTLDLCGPDRKNVLETGFGNTPEGRWLKENAPKYGFHHSYTEENSRETGYRPEPWHVRYKGVNPAKQ